MRKLVAPSMCTQLWYFGVEIFHSYFLTTVRKDEMERERERERENMASGDLWSYGERKNLLLD